MFKIWKRQYLDIKSVTLKPNHAQKLFIYIRTKRRSNFLSFFLSFFFLSSRSMILHLIEKADLIIIIYPTIDYRTTLFVMHVNKNNICNVPIYN